eukprot:UN24949
MCTAMGVKKPKYEKRWVKLHGLPYNTPLRSVFEFFAVVKVFPIRLVRRSDGSQVYAEFATEGDVNNVMKLQQRYIGHRYVELFPCHTTEVEQVTGKKLKTKQYSPSQFKFQERLYQQIPQLYNPHIPPPLGGKVIRRNGLYPATYSPTNYSPIQRRAPHPNQYPSPHRQQQGHFPFPTTLTSGLSGGSPGGSQNNNNSNNGNLYSSPSNTSHHHSGPPSYITQPIPPGTPPRSMYSQRNVLSSHNVMSSYNNNNKNKFTDSNSNSSGRPTPQQTPTHRNSPRHLGGGFSNPQQLYNQLSSQRGYHNMGNYRDHRNSPSNSITPNNVVGQITPLFTNPQQSNTSYPKSSHSPANYSNSPGPSSTPPFSNTLPNTLPGLPRKNALTLSRSSSHSNQQYTNISYPSTVYKQTSSGENETNKRTDNTKSNSSNYSPSPAVYPPTNSIQTSSNGPNSIPTAFQFTPVTVTTPTNNNNQTSRTDSLPNSIQPIFDRNNSNNHSYPPTANRKELNNTGGNNSNHYNNGGKLTTIPFHKQLLPTLNPANSL